MNDKKLPNVLFYYTSLVYLELIFRVFCTENIFPVTFINTLIYLIIIALFLSIITSLSNEKINTIFSRIILFGITFLYSTCLVFKLKFEVFFSINSLGLANQLTSFLNDTFKTISNDIIPIILLFIPFILSFILKRFINFEKNNSRHLIAYLIGIILISICYFGTLFVNKDKYYSLYNLYYKIDNHSLVVEKLGVLPSTMLEIRKKFISNKKSIDNIYIEPKEDIKNNSDNDNNTETKYNNLEIDFDILSSNTNDKTIKIMNDYFKNETGTKQNEYTNMYDGKNLILFMAESFNSIAVSKELTPTLYKLSHEGFVFENFYSPVILSTIGGEFQELTGLYPHLNLLSSIWRKGTNYFPYGIGNVFNNKGYNTFAYHNNQYNFQSRDKYLKAIGFNNYKGCWNGLEKKINCNIWPESDVEMINGTINDYINSDKPFMTYYVTVSGHMAYNWGNAMSLKHKDEVKNLPYSEPVKAYIATQIELDKALELLINKLNEAGKLDDTVIALVGDHYPYDLTINQINELSTYERDSVVEINHSNFILWNNKTNTTVISKVGSQIDVLPTLLNLFGVSYDSRLIVGKDILADTEGLAIFSNNSWISDKGVYYSSSNTFIPNDNYEVTEEYIANMNNIVSNKINISKYILEKNYYKYIFNK